MSIFGNKKILTIGELNEKSLYKLKDDVEKEIYKRNELRKGTTESIAKDIRELFNLKENKNKFFVYNDNGYINIIRVSGTSVVSASNSDVTIHSYKSGVEYGTYGKIWERLNNYSNEMYITIHNVNEDTINKVKECFKTEEEVIDIINKHLDKCCEEFVKHHFDIAKRRLNLK